MQSPESNSSEKQGAFSISLWNSAFREALQRLCPVRGAGHECGCLPVLARMVLIRYFTFVYVLDNGI